MMNKDILEILGDVLDNIRRDVEDWNVLVSSIHVPETSKKEEGLPF